MRRKRRIIPIIIAAVVLLLLTLSALDVRLRVVSYTVTDGRIETPVRIVLITDLHSCKYGEGQKKLLDAIDAQKPDLILLGGDIFDDDLPNDNTLTVLKHVSERYRCFYVSGNHEYWYEDPEALLDTVRDLGIPILHGTCETVSVGQTTLNLCGIADPACAEIGLDENATEQRKAAREAVTAEQLQSAKDAAEDGYYTILLAHRPELIETYAQYGFDLVVSGHAHGGQVRIPGLVNGLFSPGEQWFPKYAGGEYRVEETLLIVSRGLARESTAAPRIWNRPELAVIELLPEDQNP